ncbi:MAG: nuclear transport factor 2 family protein [Gemmatimonadales bacterium]
MIAALDSAVRWMEAESFIYADGKPQIFIAGGQTIVVEGRYRGKVKATGKPIDSQFAHVFEFRDGKVIRFQQYTDTKQWAQAVQP